MIFIDCEFTGMEERKPEFLSIGLVSDDGRELYIELSGETHLTGASTFVLDTVVPQFGLMPHAVESQNELGQRVGAWLLELGQSSIEVAYDYHTDFDLLERALQCAGLWDPLKSVIKPTHIGYLTGQDDVVAAMERTWADSFAVDGIARHHALADARALRWGFVAMHGARPIDIKQNDVLLADLADDAKRAADSAAAAVDDAINFVNESNLRIAGMESHSKPRSEDHDPFS